MDKRVKMSYERAMPFDEGAIAQSAEYLCADRARREAYRALAAELTPSAEVLLDLYLEALDEVAELEARHYFQEGYRAVNT